MIVGHNHGLQLNAYQNAYLKKDAYQIFGKHEK
jgi:hypothetical protein